MLSFFLILRHNFVCRYKVLFPLYKRLMKKRSNTIPLKKEKIVILMVKNETTFCGGLSDRFRGITSVYQECKQQGINFKIYLIIRTYLIILNLLLFSKLKCLFSTFRT